MAPAVIIFHRNITNYIPKKWVEDCVNDIKNQTYKDFTVFEVDYGGSKNQIYKGSRFYNKKFKTHAEAHNFLCEEAIEKGFDCVFNINIDDRYHWERIERQLPLMQAYDVVSCNMTQINKDDEYSTPEFPVFAKQNGKFIKLQTDILFSQMDLEYNFFVKNHNILAHPGCVYSKNFIENSGLLVPEEIPKDDFKLWKRTFYKFAYYIVPYTLLFYRIHEANISSK